MNQSDTDLLLARAQVAIAFLFSIGFMSILFVLIFYYSNLSAPANTLLSGLTGALVTIVTQQSAFFFARQRPNALPDPTTTSTVTTTTTTPTPLVVPEGSKLVAAPPPPAQIVTPTPETPDATKTTPATPPAV